MNLLSALRKILHFPCSGEVRQAAQISAAGSRYVQRAAQHQKTHAEHVKRKAESCIRDEDALNDLVIHMARKNDEKSR
jgi:hypothetical protein